jgi:hypothetical protein
LGGVWQQAIPERNPIYLKDRDLPKDEFSDRNLKCTFNVILQGAGCSPMSIWRTRDHRFGHSTGGRWRRILRVFQRRPESSASSASAAADPTAGVLMAQQDRR